MPDNNALPTRFPWRDGIHIKLLLDGEAFFPEMLQGIRNAKQFILMEMYLCESGKVASEFIHAFSEAAQRGVKVQLLLDDFGAKKLILSDRNKLLEAGVELVFYNPLYFKQLKQIKQNLYRTHRKYLIIDGETVFVGGAGITDHFYGDNAWRETMVKASGEVVLDWQRLFTHTFQKWSDQPVPALVESHPIKNTTSARLNYTSGGDSLEIKRVLLNRMHKCENTLWLASAYFIPSRKIRKALRQMALKGCDVRLLLPGSIIDHPSVRYASRRYYARLLRFGVRMFEYQERFTHTKLVLVDDWYTIGSSNIDRWNFRWNLEANLDVRSQESATEVRNMLLTDFEHCEEIHYVDWVNRSKLMRFKEWLWGRVDIWLTRFSNKPH